MPHTNPAEALDQGQSETPSVRARAGLVRCP